MKTLTRLLLLAVLFVLASFATSTDVAWADSSEGGIDCATNEALQVSSFDQGSACSVPVSAEDDGLFGMIHRTLRFGLHGLMSFTRYGQTYEYTSQSSSEISEDVINVDAWLYITLTSSPGWTFEDDCFDHNTNTFLAACRTYSSGCYDRKQVGSHFFHTTGWVDTTLGTVDYWDCD